MPEPLRPSEIAGEAYGFAARSMVARGADIAVFVAAFTAWRVASEFGFWPGAAGWALMLVAGCALSQRLYRDGLDTAPADAPHATNLLKANLAVYLAFGMIGFFLLFFLLIFAGVVLQVATGLDNEAAQADPDAITRALEQVAATPYGVVLGLMAAAAVGALGVLALRLLVFGAATVDVGAARIFRTWGLTRGRVGRLAVIGASTHLAPFLAALLGAAGLGAAAPELGRWGDAVVSGLLSGVFAGVFVLPGHGAAIAVWKRLGDVGALR